MGSLKQYAAPDSEASSVRDCYGLAKSTANSPRDIRRVRSLIHNDTLIIVKGIMSEEDALEALAYGADGIWVSNGGGQRAKSSPSVINVLKRICSSVRKVNPRCSIFVDSGITRGTDVMKCLAFGATAVFINRPIMWALEYKGQEGCEELMDILNEELKLAMALTHCFQLCDITEAQVIHKVRARL
mgnify:CR=1 FL=1